MSFREHFFRVFYPNGMKITKKEVCIIKTTFEMDIAKKNKENEKEFLEFKKSLK